MDYLNRFRPEHLIELRAILQQDVKRFWIRPADHPATEAKLLQLNGAGFDIYAGVNPRCCYASDESAVAEIVCFHADVDAMECSALENHTEQQTLPAPSLVIESGHGHHLYWHLAQPVTVSDANRSHLKAINRGLAQAAGGDPHCCDLARILRVPGYTNHKLPAAPVRLLQSSNIRYRLEELAAFALDKPAYPGPITVVPPALVSQELKDRFAALRWADKSGELQRAWRGQIGDGSSDSRYVLVANLRQAGFSADDIRAIVCSRRWYNRHSGQVRQPLAVQMDVARLLAKLA